MLVVAPALDIKSYERGGPTASAARVTPGAGTSGGETNVSQCPTYGVYYYFIPILWHA